MTFTTLGLSNPILRALKDKGYTTPTPIQTQAIPAIIAKRDVMACAQTGSGKTAGFTLPVLDRLALGEPATANAVRGLILVPTRELAAQVEESVQHYGKYLSLKSTVVYGGVKINPQMMKLRRGVDILVATPGRLLDLYEKNAVNFRQIEILVLDEADRMLDLGFINDIRKIISLLPQKRQNLLFSATYPNDIIKLAKGMLNNSVRIDISPHKPVVQSIKQIVYPVDKRKKTNLLIHLINENKWEQVLVFTRTKRGADKLTAVLEKYKITAVAIHSDKNQSARIRALTNFKNGKTKVLVATDLAARGIDITELPHVVNFDLPDVAEYYIHRIGRTGRAGKKGQAVSLVCADEVEALTAIESLLGRLLPREFISGFEPDHNVPQTQLKALKPKKPKKPKKNAAREVKVTNGKNTPLKSKRRNPDQRQKKGQRKSTIKPAGR